jgi:hypothetical protein
MYVIADELIITIGIAAAWLMLIELLLPFGGR